MAVLTQGLLVVRCLNVYVKTIDTPPAKTQTSGYGDYKVLLVAYSVLKSVLVLLLSHGSGNTYAVPATAATTGSAGKVTPAQTSPAAVLTPAAFGRVFKMCNICSAFWGPIERVQLAERSPAEAEHLILLEFAF